MEGQVTVALGTLRRFANDALLAPTRRGERRLKVVPGVGTLSAVSAPSPVSLVPVKDEPGRIRVMGTMPLYLSRGPLNASIADFADLGRVVARYDAVADLVVRDERGGWRVQTLAVDALPPEITLGSLPAGLEPAVAEAATALLKGLVAKEAADALQGLILARIAPWPGVDGPAALGAVEARMDGALLRIGLRPRGPLGTGLDRGHRALDPGAGHDATVGISPAWITALAAAGQPEALARHDGVDYRVTSTLQGPAPTARVHARRTSGCGWVEVEQGLKVGRTGKRWGIAPRGEATVLERGGDDRRGDDSIARAVAEAAARRLDDRLQHPLFTAPDGRMLQAQIVRYEGGAVLFDGTMAQAPGGLRVPPPSAPPPPAHQATPSTR